LLYDVFNGGISVTTAANVIADDIARKFNMTNDIAAIYNAVKDALNLSLRNSDGNLNWIEMGQTIGDLAVSIVSFLPIGKIPDIVAVLWTSAGAL